MLTIHINKNASGLVSYFTNSLAKDDYFFSGKSIPGRWHGKLVDVLGLPEKVSQKSFSRMAHNRHPVTGKKLTARDAANRRTSIEYTFAAPKSVSLIMALAEKEEGRSILNAHRQAVKKAMAEIEADMRTQTRIDGRKVFAKAEGIVFGRFDHFTARPVKDGLGRDGRANYVSDPHLHSHCIAMNACIYNGKFQAIEGSTVHRMAGYYEALYHAHLSKGLSDLGYEIQRTKDRWEIRSPGMTRATLEKFSKRTLEINQKAVELGISDAKAKGALGAKIRVNKSKVKEDVDLQSTWLKRLTDREAKAISSARNLATLPPHAISVSRAVDMALSHHLERRSTVPTKKLLAKAMALGYGQLTPDQIKKELAGRKDVLSATIGYHDHVTTREMVRAEDTMIGFAVAGKATRTAINPDHIISRSFLNEGQRNAVEKILRSTDRVQILMGAAGVGKSTLLVEVREAAEANNRRVLAFAPSSGASRGVLREKGFEGADTIAAFLRSSELQAKAKGQIILIDEASLVGVKTMGRIFDVARKSNAQVILAGDVKQHSSPEAGDAMRILQDKAQLRVAHVDTILRQRANPKLKAAIEALAAGKGKSGFDKLDQQDAIIEIKDPQERHQHLAHNFVASIISNRTALVIAPTHAEGKILTAAIRTEMKNRGRIGKDEKAVKILKPLPTTQAQRADAAQYEPGMVLQFHQNAKGGFKAGKRYTITTGNAEGILMVNGDGLKTPQPLPLRQGDRFQLMREDSIQLGGGDIIRVTANGKSRNGRRIYNGQVFRIKGFDKEDNIVLSNGNVLDKAFGNIAYGVVTTSHASQGKDAKDVFIAQGSMSLPATNAQQFYVSASRAKDTLRIYTDDKDELRKAVVRSGERMSASEIARRQTNRSQRIKRNRNHYLDNHINSKTHDKDARRNPTPERTIFRSGGQYEREVPDRG